MGSVRQVLRSFYHHSAIKSKQTAELMPSSRLERALWRRHMCGRPKARARGSAKALRGPGLCGFAASSCHLSRSISARACTAISEAEGAADAMASARDNLSPYSWACLFRHPKAKVGLNGLVR